MWQGATAPHRNLYTAVSDSDTEDPDVRTKPCFKRNHSSGQDLLLMFCSHFCLPLLHCSLLFRSLLCFPSPHRLPSSFHPSLFSPTGFQAVAMVIVGHRQMFVIVWLHPARFYLNGQVQFYPPSLYNLLFGLFISAKSLTLFLVHSSLSFFLCSRCNLESDRENLLCKAVRTLCSLRFSEQTERDRPGEGKRSRGSHIAWRGGRGEGGRGG